MAVQAQQVKELREKTGAGIMDCKEALKETEGNLEDAKDFLRKKGIETAQGKTAQTSEGRVGTYVHMNGSIGVIVEVNCQTDFVAKTEQFANFVEELSMHIAAQKPRWVSREDVPEQEIEREKDIIGEQFQDEDKPDHVIEQILKGKLDKNFFQQNVLLEQPYIRDPEKTIQEYLNELVADLDENINIRRFIRYEVGEGIEVEEENFAEEVAKEVA